MPNKPRQTARKGQRPRRQAVAKTSPKAKATSMGEPTASTGGLVPVEAVEAAEESTAADDGRAGAQVATEEVPAVELAPSPDQPETSPSVAEADPDGGAAAPPPAETGVVEQPTSTAGADQPTAPVPPSGPLHEFEVLAVMPGSWVERQLTEDALTVHEARAALPLDLGTLIAEGQLIRVGSLGEVASAANLAPHLGPQRPSVEVAIAIRRARG